MSYTPATDPNAVDLELNQQYTVSTDPTATDFDLATDGSAGLEGSTIEVTSNATLTFTNVAINRAISGSSTITVENNSVTAKNKVRLVGDSTVTLSSNSTLAFTNVPVFRSIVGQSPVGVTSNAVTGVNRSYVGSSTVTVEANSPAAKNKIRFVGDSLVTVVSASEIAIGRVILGASTINVASNAVTGVNRSYVGSSTVTVEANSPAAKNKVRIVGENTVALTSNAATTFTDLPANQTVIGNSTITVESNAVLAAGQTIIGDSTITFASNSAMAKNKVRIVGASNIDITPDTLTQYTNVPVSRQLVGLVTTDVISNAELTYARNRNLVGASSIALASSSAMAKNKVRIVGDSLVLLTVRGETAVNRSILGISAIGIESNTVTKVGRSINGSATIEVQTNSPIAKNRDRIVGSATIDVTSNAVASFTNVVNNRDLVGALTVTIENNSDAAKNKDRITGNSTVSVTPNATKTFTNVSIFRFIFGEASVSINSNSALAVGRAVLGQSNVTVTSASSPARNKDRIIGAATVEVTSNAVVDYLGRRSLSGIGRIRLASNAETFFFDDSESNTTDGETRLLPSSNEVLSGVDFGPITINVETLEPGTITSVRAVLRTGEPGEGVVINNATSSFTLTGAYLGAFADKFTYTDAGESDRTQTPKTVTYLQNLPSGKNLFKLEQDLRPAVDVKYDVTVDYTVNIPAIPPVLGDPGTPARTYSGTEVLTYTQTVLQNRGAIRRLMAEYKFNGTGALA